MNKNKFLTAREMFPELADINNERRFIDFIKVPDLRLFCEKCIEKANKTITSYNHNVSEFMLDLMIRKELLTPDNHQTYVDALLIAAQLFDTYFDINNPEEVHQLLLDTDIYPEGFIRLLYKMKEDRIYIMNVYHSLHQEEFQSYLSPMIQGLLKMKIEEKADNMIIQESDKEFIARFYSYCIVGLLIDWMNEI